VETIDEYRQYDGQRQGIPRCGPPFEKQLLEHGVDDEEIQEEAARQDGILFVLEEKAVVPDGVIVAHKYIQKGCGDNQQVNTQVDKNIAVVAVPHADEYGEQQTKHIQRFVDPVDTIRIFPMGKDRYQDQDHDADEPDIQQGEKEIQVGAVFHGWTRTASIWKSLGFRGWWWWYRRIGDRCFITGTVCLFERGDRLSVDMRFQLPLPEGHRTHVEDTSQQQQKCSLHGAFSFEKKRFFIGFLEDLFGSIPS
jgi:hypothetical protein